MSKKRIEENIPKAIEVLNKRFADRKIPKAYNGYISSFGASVIQSGLKTTLAVFGNPNNKDKTKEDKSVLPELILKLMPSANAKSLLDYVLANPDKEDALKSEIIDKAIALKLAIRTFELV